MTVAVAAAVRNGEAALELAEAGWHVFPCRESGPLAKAPRTANGHLDATRDPDDIRALWRQHPAALIGAVVPDSLIVLDLDPRNGGSVEALEALAEPLPETLTVLSGRQDGGRHLYFLRPAGQFTSTRVPAGVDLKVHGYMIMPPSLHPVTGKPYRWELRDPVTLPPRLRELLRPPTPPPPPSRPVSGDGAALVRHVMALREGNRNNGLFWAACRAVEDGHDITDELIQAARSVGIPEREARRTVASAARANGGGR
ncbi:MAG: bifunctional DNA primase/polymerase [Dehalococcoidia bacterium]|nr:bifunctional DNA primase/polymerase [Dehalococcoidia bacterium]